MAGVGSEENKHGFGLGKALKDAKPSHNVGKFHIYSLRLNQI